MQTAESAIERMVLPKPTYEELERKCEAQAAQLAAYRLLLSQLDTIFQGIRGGLMTAMGQAENYQRLRMTGDDVHSR